MGMMEEDCGVEQPVLDAIETQGEMPCPYKTAEMVKASGASPADIMGWLGTFLSELSSQESVPDQQAKMIGYLP